MTYDDPQQLPPEFHEQPLTARMLDDFTTCPRKLLLSFFTTRDAERHFRGGSAALHQAVRHAVLGLHAAGWSVQTPLQVLLASFESHWDGSLCADALEEEQLHDQGLRMLREYYEDHYTAPPTTFATDLRLSGAIGTQAFVAVADLVLDRGEGRREYTRLVTSRSPLGPAELARDVSAQLLWLLVREQPGAEDSTVSYYALRKRKAYEVVLDAEQAEYARREFESRVGRIHRETEFEPRKGKYCRWCRSRSRCPAWRR